MDALLAAASEEIHSVHMGTSSSSSSLSSSTQPIDGINHHAKTDNEHQTTSPTSNNYAFELPILPAVARANGDDGSITWQQMFNQTRDFVELGNTRIPPRISDWLNAQRRQYKMYGIGIKKPTGIITGRIRQLNSIGIDWTKMIEVDDPNRAVQKYPGSPIHPRVILPPSQRGGNDNVVMMHDGRPFSSKKSKKRGGHRDDTQVMLNIIHGRGTVTRGQDWTVEEDSMIEHYQKEWGSKWSKMAKVFNNGRNDKEISRRFTTLQRARQRDKHRRMETELDNVVDEEELSDSGDEDYSSYGSEARTEQVQNLVRAALAKDRRGGRVSRSQDFTMNTTTSHPKAKRSRKPSRRVQESYSALEDDSFSSSYMSEGEDNVSVSFHGNSIAAAIPKMLDASSKKQFFPDILFRLVNECSTYQPHVLDWIPDGTAFIVKEPTLMPEILSRYFRHNKLSSLTRMC